MENTISIIEGNDMGKGADYEREISKKLSLWWTQNLDEPRDDIFWRTAGSGAWATTRSKKGKSTANSQGDIKALDPIGQPFLDYFSVEIKRGYSSDISVLSLMDGKGSKHALLEFWQQAERDRIASNRQEALLIFKRDRKNPCIIITQKLYRKISHYCNTWDHEYHGVKIVLNYKGYTTLVLLPLDPFLNWFNPEVVSGWLV